MKKQNEKRRINMKWLPMDARQVCIKKKIFENYFLFIVQMTFDDNQFSVVLDKGTFDALMSNKNQQVRFKKKRKCLWF